MRHLGVKSDADEEDVVVGLFARTPRNELSKFALPPYQAQEFKATLKLKESIMEIMTWSPQNLHSRLVAFTQDPHAWETDYSKLLIFVCGNLDEMYADAASRVEDCDTDADVFHERMQRLALLGIDLEHGKSRHPQRRPFIERLNRSLKEALETLPGCTRFNGKDGMRDPVALGDRLMDLAELQRWVVRWYYESWMHNVLERLERTQAWEDTTLGNTPAKRWTSMSEQLGFVMPLRSSLHVRNIGPFSSTAAPLATTGCIPHVTA